MNQIDPEGHYRALGVRPGAPFEEVQAAFRKLSKTVHPDVDKSAGADARFRDILDRYLFLKDPVAKAAYDARFAEALRRPSGLAPINPAAGTIAVTAAPSPANDRGPAGQPSLWHRLAADAYGRLSHARAMSGGLFDLAA